MKALSPLKRWRVNQPLTQRALAERLGVSVYTIHMWETHQVSEDRVEDVREITGLSASELRPLACECKGSER